VPVLKSFAGGALFGEGWGDGDPTVLALHGWQRTHLDFVPVIEAASTRAGGPLAAVGIDLPGFGATPPPPEPWGSEEYAHHLLPLFEEPGVLADRIVLVGHSFGGRVALHLAPLVAGRIERVVLTAVPLLDRQGRRSRPALGYRVARTLHRVGLVGEERMEALRQRYGSLDYRTAQGVMRAVFVKLLSERYADQMAAIDCPVDLVWGDTDTDVPLEVAERALPLFTSARLVTLPGVGHLTPTEAPGALADVILGRSAADDGSGSPGDGSPSGSYGDPEAGDLR
jgi:pimeloyl-ACP methyl ester carboxylesterase